MTPSKIPDVGWSRNQHYYYGSPQTKDFIRILTRNILHYNLLVIKPNQLYNVLFEVYGVVVLLVNP